MKKNLLFGLLVAATAFTTTAFTTAHEKEFATDWYTPISTTLAPNSSQAQSFPNYNSTPLEVAPTCSGTRYVCAARFPNVSAAPTVISTKN